MMILELQRQNEILRRELGYQRENNEKRNRQLDLLNMVWCDGGCDGGMGRYDDRVITADDVAMLIINAERARHWYIARAGKTTDGDRQPAWDAARAEIEAALPPAYRGYAAALQMLATEASDNHSDGISRVAAAFGVEVLCRSCGSAEVPNPERPTRCTLCDRQRSTAPAEGTR